nr:MAG TPA: hypothetical protein [Caudoviricetes sp.]
MKHLSRRLLLILRLLAVNRTLVNIFLMKNFMIVIHTFSQTIRKLN